MGPARATFQLTPSPAAFVRAAQTTMPAPGAGAGIVAAAQAARAYQQSVRVELVPFSPLASRVRFLHPSLA